MSVCFCGAPCFFMFFPHQCCFWELPRDVYKKPRVQAILLKTHVVDVFRTSSVDIIKERLRRSWYRDGRRRRRRRRLRRWILIWYWDDDAEGSEGPLSGAGSAAEPRKGSHCNTSHLPGTWGGLFHALRPSTNRWSKKLWHSCLPLAEFQPLADAVSIRALHCIRFGGDVLVTVVGRVYSYW